MTVFVLITLFIGAVASGGEPSEFCIVQDSDGWSNVRENPGTQSKILTRVDHGQVVWAFPGADAGWPNVIFMDKEGVERSGHIHRSRLKPLSDFESIDGKVFEERGLIVFEKGLVNIEVIVEPFRKEGRDFSYGGVSVGQNYLSKIDGKRFWGTDGGMPRSQYRSITVRQGNSVGALPGKALEGLFNPGLFPGNAQMVLNPGANTIYLTSFNSDGAGGYVVAFVIENGKYKSRAVFNPF